MKQVVQITILGQQFTIRSDVPPEEVRRVADFVNGKISEIVRSNRAVDTMNTAVLALLNIAGSYLQQENKIGGQEAENRLRQLLGRLEQAL